MEKAAKERKLRIPPLLASAYEELGQQQREFDVSKVHAADPRIGQFIPKKFVGAVDFQGAMDRSVSWWRQSKLLFFIHSRQFLTTCFSGSEPPVASSSKAATSKKPAGPSKGSAAKPPAGKQTYASSDARSQSPTDKGKKRELPAGGEPEQEAKRQRKEKGKSKQTANAKSAEFVDESEGEEAEAIEERQGEAGSSRSKPAEKGKQKAAPKAAKTSSGAKTGKGKSAGKGGVANVAKVAKVAKVGTGEVVKSVSKSSVFKLLLLTDLACDVRPLRVEKPGVHVRPEQEGGLPWSLQLLQQPQAVLQPHPAGDERRGIQELRVRKAGDCMA